jgi:hypothetical protein
MTHDYASVAATCSAQGGAGAAAGRGTTSATRYIVTYLPTLASPLLILPRLDHGPYEVRARPFHCRRRRGRRRECVTLAAPRRTDSCADSPARARQGFGTVWRRCGIFAWTLRLFAPWSCETRWKYCCCAHNRPGTYRCAEGGVSALNKIGSATRLELPRYCGHWNPVRTVPTSQSSPF